MDDLISRQAAINAFEKRTGLAWRDLKCLHPMFEVLEELPSAERRIGRWILYEGNDKEEYMCSECSAKELSPEMARFCWWCGAKMEVESDGGNS